MQLRHILTDKLKPWSHNPRLNDNAVDAVVDSIREFGFNAPILCDPQFEIIAGHTRWKAALRLGMTSVPVIILKLTEAQKRAFAIADNKTAEIADWDFPELAKLLEELTGSDVNMGAIGFDDGELEAILAQQQDIDWAAFDVQLQDEVESASGHARLDVKVPATKKQAILDAIAAIAQQQKDVQGTDIAITTGNVLAMLLGVDQ